MLAEVPSRALPSAQAGGRGVTLRDAACGLAAAALLATPPAALAEPKWRPTPGQSAILAMSAADTLAILGRVTRSVADGRECREKSYRRLGLQKTDGELYYLVQCHSGDEFAVRVKRDAAGSTGVMSCKVLKLVADLDCRYLRPEDYIDPM